MKAGPWLEKYLEEQKSEDKASKENEALSEETASQEENEQNTDIKNIVVFEGTLNSTAQIGRSKGFEDIAGRHENWNILDMIVLILPKQRARK